MRILFSTFGSLGDIHPFLALALEAKRRGHQPIVATSPKYRAKIEALEIEFRPVRPDLPDAAHFGDLARRVMDGKRGPEYLFKELLNPTLRQNYADLLEAGADADIFLTHPAALGGPLAARKLEKTWFSTALAPISLWSIFDPPTPPTLPQLDFLRLFGPLWGIVLKKMGQAATRAWVSEVAAIAREENLALKGHPIFNGQHSPRGVLALFSPHFCAPQRDWPRNTRALGFPFFDESGYISSDESHFFGGSENLADKIPDEFSHQPPSSSQPLSDVADAPLVFTLGSSAVWDAGEFFEQSALYAERLEKNAIFLTGKPTGKSWPAHIAEVSYAPFSTLFPRAALVVHQGGIGTTAQCLRAGVPQIVMPYAHDQNDNARRVGKLGVGRKISRDGYGQKSKALPIFLDALQKCDFTARQAGEKIRMENAPAKALDWLETVE